MAAAGAARPYLVYQGAMIPEINLKGKSLGLLVNTRYVLPYRERQSDPIDKFVILVKGGLPRLVIAKSNPTYGLVEISIPDSNKITEAGFAISKQNEDGFDCKYDKDNIKKDILERRLALEVGGTLQAPTSNIYVFPEEHVGGRRRRMKRKRTLRKKTRQARTRRYHK